MTEQVMFQTEDRVLIVGDYTAPAHPKAAVLLLHMMPADRKSWQSLAEELERRDIASLAIDLRGHGESVRKGDRTLDYRSFSDEEHQASRLDVEASLFYLKKRGFSLNKIFLIGASIGANLALQAASEHPDIPAAVLLSPGENYRGIVARPLLANLKPEQSLLVAASQGDDQESFDASSHIVGEAPSSTKELWPYTSAGHGTNLFMHDRELPKKIADWLEARLRQL